MVVRTVHGCSGAFLSIVSNVNVSVFLNGCIRLVRLPWLVFQSEMENADELFSARARNDPGGSIWQLVWSKK